MGSLGKPTVELDTTLYDLYSKDNSDADSLILIFAIPSSAQQLTSHIPNSTKFPIQGPRAAPLERDILARICLQTGPQNYAFVAGKMPLILLDIDPTENDNSEAEKFGSSDPSYRADALRVYDCLNPHQRPQLSFCVPSEIKAGSGKKFVLQHPMDCLGHLPHAFHPEIHYDLLSKPGLADSGLPTPPTKVIESLLRPDQLSDERLVDAEVSRMMASIVARDPPFVVKLPQAFASQGVFLITNTTEKTLAIETLNLEVKKMLLQVNVENRHMRVAALVVQDMITCPASFSIGLFVTKSGRSEFLSCNSQYFSDKANWSGAYVSYEEQERYEVEYREIMNRVAQFMHSKGYCGPIGIDVMTDDEGKQYVIDLNVRVTASYPLGFLKTHFSIKRGLKEAVLFCPLGLKGTRDVFETVFEREVMNGSIVICAWCEGKAGPNGMFKYSVVSIVLGARDRGELNELIERVEKFKIQK